MTYGWSVDRILSGYVQHINAVHKVMPKGLRRPGSDTANVPKQCFEFVNDTLGCEEFLRKALGNEEPLSDQEFTAWWDIMDDFAAYLNEHPWEPATRLEDPQIVEFVKVSIAAGGNGIDESTVLRWIGWGMPHQKRGRCYFVQLSVVDRWMKMKYRHKVKRHLTNKRR